MKKKKILIIEDEKAIADTLIYALESEGFETLRASTGLEGLKLLADQDFSLAILDIGLPDINGTEVCKEIRKTSSLPLFFLTARSSEVDKIVGLEIGADDYITKPFSPREVTARVKSILRRLGDSDLSNNRKDLNSDDKIIQKGSFKIDELKFKILYKENVLNLTKYEYGLLKTLLQRPGQVFSREQLMQAVWSDPDMSMDRTVDTHIKSLRNKLKESTNGADFIVTHRGIGYSVVEDLK